MRVFMLRCDDTGAANLEKREFRYYPAVTGSRFWARVRHRNASRPKGRPVTRYAATGWRRRPAAGAKEVGKQTHRNVEFGYPEGDVSPSLPVDRRPRAHPLGLGA